MIPVPPFFSTLFCDRHRKFKVHRVTFMNYSPSGDMVDYLAVCCDCEEEIDGDVVDGFIESVSVLQWEKMVPYENNPILN